MADDAKTPRVRRLYKRSLLAMIQNAVGTKLFSSFYAELPGGQVIDTFEGGNVSCAAFVSGMLAMLGKLRGGFHGTVERTMDDLRASGWQEVADLHDIQPADVVVWAPRTEDGKPTLHIGFALSAQEAVSNSSSRGTVFRYDMYFGNEHRPLIHIFRLPDWDKPLS